MKKLLSAALIFATLATGCSWFESSATTAKNDLVDCAKQDLGATVPQAGLSLLMTVVGIIFDGGTNWQGDLTALGAKYGPDAIACAAKIAADLFKTSTSGQLSTGAGTETPYDRAVRVTAGKSFR